MCGVCGERGLPGDEDVEADVAATMGGTLESWREDELDERWSIRDEDRESDKAALESRIRWKRLRAAAVRRVLFSAEPASSLEWRRSFFVSRSLRKSWMLSSSSCMDPELAGPVAASVSSPDPGWADEAALALPLLFWSSSVLLVVPPDDRRARLCEKLLLYLVVGAGLGELEVDAACSESDDGFLAVTAGAFGGGLWASSVNDPSVGTWPLASLGEVPSGEAPNGEADRVGCLKG